MIHDYDVKIKLPHIVHQCPGYDDEWPGFHTGDLKWTKLDPFELKDKIDISDITWDNRKEVLQIELVKLGINLYADKQM